MVSPSFFQVGGLHAYAADLLCVVVFVQQRTALLKHFLCKGFHASRLGDFTQTLSQAEVRKEPALTLLFFRFLCGSPQPYGTYSFQASLRIIYVSSFADGKKKKKKSQLTNREESFYLISLWSPTFWHVCSALQLNEFDHRMWVFLTVSSLLFSSPFIVSLSLFLYSCFVCFKARLPPDYPLTFFSSWWNLFCPSDS